MAVIANLTVKLQAQIAEFQSEFREATRSAEKFQNEFQGIATKASLFGNLIANGVTAAVGGLKSLAISVLDNASNIVDLSSKTGLAMRTIQEFQHVAEQTGTTVDAFTNAAFKLGANLSGGSKSVVAGVTALGLSFKDLQAQSPDEQFNKIAEALGRMENPQERNRIALELFGRAAKDVLPAIAEGYRTMADAAAVAGDQQLLVLDQLGDAWSKFVRDAQTNAAQFAGSLVLAGKAIKEGGFFDAIKLGLVTGDPLKGLVALGTQFGAVEAAAKKSAEGNKTVSKSLTEMIAELDKSTGAQKRAQQATDAHANAIRILADRLSGADLVGEVKQLSAAFNSLGDARRTPIVIQNTADAALKLFQAGAKLTPELFNIVIEAGKLTSLLPEVKSGFDGAALGIRDVTVELQQGNQQLIDFIETLNSVKFTNGIKNLDLGDEIRQFTSQLPEPLPPTFWDSLLDVKGPSLAQSARFAADNVIGSLANAIKTGDWASFKASLRDSFSQFAGSAIAAGINLLIPGLGTLLQPLFSALTSKLIGLFDRNKGRDLVESFAEGFGGFDELHKELNLLGDEGEELWKKLTQGVGRNNPDQAAKAIAEVEAAIAKYRSEQQSANITTEEGAQATIESAAQAAVALDQLNERLLTNSAAWGDWSALVTGYLQKLADDIRSLPLPGPTGTMGGSTGGSRQRLSIGGSTGGGSVSIPVGSMPSPENGSTTVILEMDSYQLAEAVVPQIPGVVQRYGLADV